MVVMWRAEMARKPTTQTGHQQREGQGDAAIK
jgi:hypothetical protein